MKVFLVFGIYFGLLADSIYGANILGLFAFPSQSHFNSIQTVMTRLAKNNHNITSISSFRLAEKLDNYEEIIVPNFDFWSNVQNDLGVKNMFEASLHSSSSNMHKAVRNTGAELVDFFLQQPKIKEILSSKEKFPYDLIVVDLFHTEALLMIGEVFDVPVVAFASSNFQNYMTALMDSAVPSACSPIDFESFTQDATFTQRISNIFECRERRNQRQKDLIAQDIVARKHFSALGRNLSPISQLLSRTSITLLNNYSPLLTSRPSVPNIIPVGGTHIKQAQSIQWNIKRFLDDAREGAIYFSLGTILKCSDIDSEKFTAIITVIGKLKEKVLWHCDLKKVENQPKNLLLQDIVSSSDVLAHPHVTFFVTSGGLLGLQEAIWRSVPILGIPVFEDHHINIRNVEKLGIGVKLDFANLTESSLSWSLEKLITDASYKTKSREVSAKFRDRLQGAVQTSVFWIDHALKFKDSSHLRAVGTEVSSFELYLGDIVVILIFVTFGLIAFGYLVYKIGISIKRKREENKLYSKLR
ncbi:UDP-glycosyltransferase UGT5 [Eupeodes corollae]|uniref:UDP-glycosyltransferase UGT5 n=1 Tax=Eupeodes corollae TaxID=290404 RepID=UPI00249237EA|nr:UDP-glycosyltransferase UGT5 [Eupeodes corollae]XP_055918805.1 UDP-glycosyltransferase UGT5 [Eupeodes corollae]XP_055918806.1 UDP-glycosyltransferase UGT5 [Eupeodes corollae]